MTEKDKNYKAFLGESKLLFHAPHGSLNIPNSEIDKFSINHSKIAKEHLHMADKFTDTMVYDLASFSKSSYFVNQISRLVCDPERFVGEDEEMESVGMGFAYTHGFDRNPIRHLSSKDKNNIFEEYYFPYASDFTHLVNKKMELSNSVCIIDVHSYASNKLPYELHDGDRPEICIGFDSYHASGKLIESVSKVLEKDYSIGLNSPFSGSYIPLDYYQKDNRISSIMIEIRRDTYMNEATGEVIPEKYNSLIGTLNKLQLKIIEIL